MIKNKKKKEDLEKTCHCHDGEECICDDTCECEDNCQCNDTCECGDECNCSEENTDILKKEIEELKSKLLYKDAEMINYRKRKDEEVEKIKKYCNQDIIVDLLPVIDNFERAIKYDDNNLEDQFSKFLSGFKIMFSDLNNILVKYGVTEVNRIGEEFDPNLEQALLTDRVDGKKDEEVLEVLLKGYMLKDRVIRPATVKINKIDE